MNLQDMMLAGFLLCAGCHPSASSTSRSAVLPASAGRAGNVHSPVQPAAGAGFQLQVQG